MKILYLSHRAPYPVDRGDRIRSYHHLRHLAATHEVHLLAFVERVVDEALASPLAEICASVRLIPVDRGRSLLRSVRALAVGQSLSVAHFDSPAMWRAVRGAGPFDVAWASSSAVAPYLRAADARKRIADFVDVDSDKWREFADRNRGPLGWVYALEAKRLRRLEREIGSAVDCVLFVSEEERSMFRLVAPSIDTAVVPNGVDSDYFRPAGRPTGDGDPHVVFTGTLDYLPNLDAALFLLREVLPLLRRSVPGVRLTVVGHRPPRRLLRVARSCGTTVTVAGSVPDIRPHFGGRVAYVAPLRFGRGVKNKVLEAMAMEVPVVATPAAMTGLGVVPGKHFLLAETASEIAASLTELFFNASLGQSLAAEARRWVRITHRWDAQLRSLDLCLEAYALPSENGEMSGVVRPVAADDEGTQQLGQR